MAVNGELTAAREDRPMMKWLIPLVFVLSACNGPGPGFHGGEKVTRRVEGSKFTLWIKQDRVVAIRTSSEVLPRYQEVARKAIIATQKETDCEAAWVVGDESLMWIGLSCDGRKAPKRPTRQSSLHCDIDDLYKRGESLAGYMTCQ